jgi:hypothetical protein
MPNLFSGSSRVRIRNVMINVIQNDYRKTVFLSLSGTVDPFPKIIPYILLK